MSSYAKKPASAFRLSPVLTSFLQHDGLPFAEILSAKDIHEAFDAGDAAFAKDQEDAVYTPEMGRRTSYRVNNAADIVVLNVKGRDQRCAICVLDTDQTSGVSHGISDPATRGRS